MSAMWPPTDSCLCGALVSAFDLGTAKHQCNRGHGSSPPDITCYFAFCLFVWYLNKYFDGVMSIFDQIIAIIGIIQSLN